MGGRLRFYSPLIVIVSGGLLSILAAPGEEIKTTECEINNSEPQTLRLVVSVQQQGIFFLHGHIMFECREFRQNNYSLLLCL